MERELEELAAEAARVLGGALRSEEGEEVRQALRRWFDTVDRAGVWPAALTFAPGQTMPLGAHHFDVLARAKRPAIDRLRDLVAQYTDPPTEGETPLTAMLVGAKLEQPTQASRDEQHSSTSPTPDLTPAPPPPSRDFASTRPPAFDPDPPPSLADDPTSTPPPPAPDSTSARPPALDPSPSLARDFAPARPPAFDADPSLAGDLTSPHSPAFDSAPAPSQAPDLTPAHSPSLNSAPTPSPAGDLTPTPPPPAPTPTPTPTPTPASTPTPTDHIEFPNGTFHAPVTGMVQGDVYIGYPTPSPHPDPSTWLTLGDTDPLALNVRGALRLKDWPKLTEYVNRDVEENLERWFEEDGLLVIRGRRFAGKTRTAWETLFVDLPPDTRVYFPAPGTDLRTLPTLLKDRPGRYVLWLDDLDAHLSHRDLDPHLLAELKRARVPVVGTMNDDVYETHMDAADTLAHRVLAQARIERLSTAWSEPELRRAGDSADPRLVEALEWRGETGVTQYLAVAPLLAEVWRRLTSRSLHYPGDSLLLTVLDLVRCGLRGDLPLSLLIRLSPRPHSDRLEQELAWASKERHRLTGYLVPGTAPDTWRPYGSLVADALRGSLPPVRSSTWRHVLEATADDPDARHAVLSAARAHFTPLAEAGKTTAMHMMGVIKEADGDQETALHWYRKAADAGMTQVAEQVGRLLLARSAPDQALPYLRTAADRTIAPNPTALRLLAEAHLALAEQALRTAADAGDSVAPHRLGDLDLRLGDASRAAQYHLRLDQDAPTARSLAVYHLLRGETETAEPYLERAIHDGDDRAVRIRDDLRAGPQSLDDAERHFRRGADPRDVAHLGVVLEKAGRTAEALARYDEAAARGDSFARARAQALRRNRDTVEE